MATSLIDQLIADSLADLGRRESVIVSRLIAQYGVSLKRIQRELRTIDAQIAGLQQAGEPVPAAWLTRQRWWQDMERSIQRELLIWQGQALNGLSALQTGGVHVAVGLSADIAKAAGSPLTGQVYKEAFERWVTVTRPGSPVRAIIDGYGERVSESIMHRMTEGIGGGKGPGAIVREIMVDIGGDGSEARLMTLARTETMRAFRGANADTLAPLQEQGIISGYIWLATLDGGACLSCIERHGTFFPNYPTGWHPRCRCVARPSVNPDIVPGGQWRGQSGPNWFAEQDEKTQRRILLSDARFDAYQAGTPLSEMVTTRRSAVWGDTVGIRPLATTPGVQPRRAPAKVA